MTNQETKIVTLTADDWERYRNIRLRALREEPQAYLDTYEQKLLDPPEKWKQRIEEAAAGRAYLYFAEKSGSLVGMIGAFFKGDQSKATIAGVFVAQEARGQGIGKLLMQTILNNLMKRPGLKVITLSVNTKQIVARTMYERMGFAKKEQINFIAGDGKEYPEFIMDKVL